MSRYRLIDIVWFFIISVALTAAQYYPQNVHFLLDKLNINFPGIEIMVTFLSTIVYICVALIGFLSYYYHLPFSHDLFRRKARLVLVKLTLLTKGLVFDVWVVVIIVLIVTWMLGWYHGFMGVWFIWCCIIWVYKLEEADVCELSSSSNHRSADVYNNDNETAEEFNLRDTLLLFESRLNKLERDLNNLKSDKIQQNIALYTFNHQLSLRIQTLEENFQQVNKEQQNQTALVFDVVQRVHSRQVSKFKLVFGFVQSIWHFNVKINNFILRSLLPTYAYQTIKDIYHVPINVRSFITKKLTE